MPASGNTVEFTSTAILLIDGGQIAEAWDVDDVSLASKSVGEGSPILLLNGYAATSADWDLTFLSALGTGGTVPVIGWSMGGFVAQQPAHDAPSGSSR